MDATFRAGGLASGLDTNTIVDELVKLQRRPIDLLKQKQSGLKVQVSTLGDLLSKLNALDTAAKALSDTGAVAVTVTQASSPSSFAASPGTGAQAGRYKVEVLALAEAAKSRSQGFSAATAPVTGGSLDLLVMGTHYTASFGDGAALSDVALAINQSGAPLSAVVLSDGTQSYLSLTNRDTGFPLTGTSADALTVTETYTGTQGQKLQLAPAATAANARVAVDGLTFTRTSNVITDAVPGTTLSLKAVAAPEDLVLATDAAGTQAKLQTFASAYNDVIKVVQRQLAVTDATNRDSTLAGDGALRSLQARLAGLLSTETVTAGAVRSLADAGFETQRDGTLTLDATTVAAALAKDPSAVDRLFSRATTGISTLTHGVTDAYADSLDGVLTKRKQSLDARVSSLDKEMERIAARVDRFQQNLIAQFAAMEKVVSSIKAIGTFLTQQEQAANRKD